MLGKSMSSGSQRSSPNAVPRMAKRSTSEARHALVVLEDVTYADQMPPTLDSLFRYFGTGLAFDKKKSAGGASKTKPELCRSNAVATEVQKGPTFQRHNGCSEYCKGASKTLAI